MTDSTKTIHVDDETALARVLEQADEAPIRLDKGGTIYRIAREDEAVLHDAAAIGAAIDATRGSWSDLDADAVINYIYRGREEGTRPATRP